MNAGYYAQPNVDAMHSSECHVPRDIYRPRLRVGTSQDEEQASQKSMFNRPDELLHIARPVQAVMVSGCTTVDRIGLMICFSRGGRSS